MNKIVLILIFFIISCTKNSNINSSNSDKVTKEESIKEKNIKKESETILVNFNKNVIFNLPSKINTVKFSYLKNNMGRHNYKINNTSFTKYLILANMNPTLL